MVVEDTASDNMAAQLLQTRLLMLFRVLAALLVFRIL